MLSLILYGSRARGDFRKSSDIDLLGIIPDGIIHKEVYSKGVSLYNYPYGALLKKSESGDLFTHHIIKEGRPLYDTAGVFDRISDAFSYKDSYDTECREAAAVIWYLASRSKSLQTRAARKRLVWAIRTVIVSSAANEKVAVFSSEALSKYVGMPEVRMVIDKRYVVERDLMVDCGTSLARYLGYTRRQLGLPLIGGITDAAVAEFGPIAATTPLVARSLKRWSPDIYE